jgi:hypothetical protein
MGAYRVHLMLITCSLRTSLPVQPPLGQFRANTRVLERDFPPTSGPRQQTFPVSHAQTVLTQRRLLRYAR